MKRLNAPKRPGTKNFRIGSQAITQASRTAFSKKKLTITARETVIGRDDKGAPVALSPRDFSTGVMIMGKPGSGKTTVEETCAIEDIKRGRGICIIDPHADLYWRILTYAAWRTERGLPCPEIIACDPSNGWICPTNPFRRGPGSLSAQVDRRVQATLKAWDQHSGDQTPRLEKWLKCFYTALIEKGLTLPDINYFLDRADPKIRKMLLAGLESESIQAKLDRLATQKDFAAQIDSVESRMMRFTESDLVRRMMGVGVNAIDHRAIMDEGKVLLMNLAPSAWLSEAESRLIGTTTITEFYEAAIARPKGSKAFKVYIDEAGRFVVPELGRALDETRKKGLAPVYGFQHLWQFRDDDVKLYKSIKNSALTKIVFAIKDREDAAELADDLCMGLAEPEIKYMEYRLNHLVLDVRDTARGISHSASHSRSATLAQSIGESRGTTESVSAAWGESEETSESETDGENFSTTFSDQFAEGDGLSTSTALASGSSASVMSNQAPFAGATPYMESSFDGETEVTAESHFSSQGWSEAETEGTSHAVTRGTSRGVSTQQAITHGSERSTSNSLSSAETVGADEGITVSETDQPGTRHIPFKEGTRVDWTLEEKRWRAAELFMNQPTGHCFIKVNDAPLRAMRSYKAKAVRVSREFFRSFLERLHRTHCLSIAEADRLIEERKKALLSAGRKISVPYQLPAPAVESQETPPAPDDDSSPYPLDWS